MKINIVVPLIFKVGGIKTIFEYANGFYKMGHKVTVFSPLIPYNMKTGKNSFIHFIRNIPRLFFNLFSYKRRLSKFEKIDFKIKQVPIINNLFLENADITIATSWPTAYSVYKLNKNKGKKFYFVQGYEEWNSDLRLVNNSYKLGLEIITTSKFLKMLLKEKFSVNANIVFNSINTDIYFNPNKKNGAAKSILFILHGMKLKNSDLAIDVVKEIKMKYPNIIIRAFGHKKIHTLPDYISFYENPTEKEIVNLYCKSDIFIFTSDHEGFALPPAEAMSCGCAVVTTNVGAVPEYSRNLFSAIHVMPRDKQELINGVSFLIENEAEFKYISNNAVFEARKILNCFQNSSKLFENLLIKKVI